MPPGRSSWRAEVDGRGLTPESPGRRGPTPESVNSKAGPAIFWPCGKGALPHVPRQSAAAAAVEVAGLREECRGFQEWLRAELDAQFSSLERRVDRLDGGGHLQEQQSARLRDVESQLALLSTQLQRCELGIGGLRELLLSRPPSKNRRLLTVQSEGSAAESERHIARGEKGPGLRVDPSASDLASRQQSGGRDRINSLESLRDSTPNPFQARSRWVERVYAVLNEPESGGAALWYARLWPVFVVLSALLGLAPNFGESPWRSASMAACDVVLEAVFGFECALRFAICPSTLGFFTVGSNIADLAAAAPLALRAASGFGPPCSGCFTEALLLCLVPLLRLLKMLRWMKQFHLFRQVIDDTREALVFLLFMLLIIVLVFASIIYLVEPRSNVASLPQAMWLTIVTVTTVGYGQPETEAGHCAVTALLISSVLYMAMPIGILGNAFTQVWRDRDLILLAIRTEDRLAQWGYTARDIPKIFRIFDHEQKGELAVHEFSSMISELRVGLTEERTIELFDMLDKDGGGSIDGKEFLRVLFPRTYYELYGSKAPNPIGRKPTQLHSPLSPGQGAVARLPTWVSSMSSAKHGM